MNKVSSVKTADKPAPMRLIVSEPPSQTQVVVETVIAMAAIAIVFVAVCSVLGVFDGKKGYVTVTEPTNAALYEGDTGVDE